MSLFFPQLYGVATPKQLKIDSSSGYTIEYITVVKNFIYPEGHQNCITGSKCTAILLRGGGDFNQEGSAPAACAAGLIS